MGNDEKITDAPEDASPRLGSGHYRLLFDHATQGIGYFDLEGRVIALNTVAANRLGGSPEGLVGKSVEELLGEEMGAERRRRIESVLQSEVSQTYEDKISTGDGERWYYTTYTRIVESDGRCVGVQVVSADITAHKMSEQNLRDSERKMRSIFRAAPVGIGIVRDRVQNGTHDRVLDDVNERFCEITGYSKDEVIGESTRILYPSQETFEWVGREKQRQVAAHGTGSVETQFQHKDGRIIDVFLSLTPLDLDNPSAGATFAVLDITERKNAEKALRESEERLSILFERAADAIHVVDLQGHFLQVNAAACRATGYSEAELLQMTVMDVDTEKTTPERFQAFSRSLSPGDTTTIESHHRRKDGTIYPVEITISLFETPEGMRILGIAREITSRREAEEALRESEERFRTVIEDLPGGVFAHDLDGRFVLVNDAAARNTGYSREELMRMSVSDIDPSSVTRDDRTRLWQRLRRGDSVTVESKHVRKDGSAYPTEIHLSAVTLQSQPIILAVAYDISDRRHNEAALRESEERFREIFENMGSGVAIYDAVDGGADFIIKDINPAGARIGKIKREDHFGRRLLDVYPGVRDLGLFEVFQEVWRDGKPRHFPLSSYHDDRITLWVENYVCRLPTGEVVAVYDDVTEQRQTEKALRTSEERSRGIISSIADPMVMMDEGLTVTWANENAVQTFGDIVGKKCYAAFRGGSKEPCEDCTARGSFSDGSVHDREVEIRDRRGRLRTFWCTSSVASPYNSDEPGLVVEILRDVTDRKEAERELVRHQRAIALNNRIANVFLTSPRQDLYPDVLEVIQDELESPYGLFGYIDEEGNLVCPSMTRNVWAACQMPDKSMVFPRDAWAGLWGRALEGKKTEMANEGLRLPDGHVQLKCALATPLVHYGTLVGLFVVADKPGNYNTADMELLESAAAQTAPVLSALLQEERQAREREILEQQYRQAQKMEAIGQLTGGVAHDFNNLLQVINGSAELAREDLEPSHPVQESLGEIASAGARAAQLVSQLLVFSRRQVMRPEVLDINETVSDMLKMLGRVIGEHVQLRWHPARHVGAIKADRGMIEQALMNLCVNARDAMPEGGILTIETADQTIDDTYSVTHPDAVVGRYTVLSVGDTGCGMEAETLDHVFEPFFTTKETGKGTGLGLSTVYGIMKQHDGMVHVYSEPGQGTVLRLYWPVTEEALPRAEEAEGRRARGGTETILLVEDNEMVCQLGQSLLERAGYTVITASNGTEALDVFAQRGDEIDLAVLDVVMPEMGGLDAYEQMQGQRPDLRAIFASGYSESAIHTNFVLDKGLTLIQKPFTRNGLLEAVRNALDASRT